MPTPTPADIINHKAILPSPRNSREWGEVDVETRADGVFSAGVTDGVVLTDMRARIYDFLANSRDEATGTLKTGSKSEFAHQMRGVLEELGYADAGSLSQAQDDVTNIASMRRLELIFKTQVAMARGRSAYAMQMTPRMQRLFPAFRFVRRPGSKVKRPIHETNEDVVRLKSDNQFWADEMNSPDIGGFKLPYPPFGFNSNMDQEPVSAKETRDLGLIRDEPEPKDDADEPTPYFPAYERKASVAGMPGEVTGRIQSNLEQRFGKVKVEKDQITVPEGSGMPGITGNPYLPFVMWGIYAGAISQVLKYRKTITELTVKLKAGEMTRDDYESELNRITGAKSGIDVLIESILG